MPVSNVDFGKYLQSVAERDIDLLLMEEFHVDPSFSNWFACSVGLKDDAAFDGAWHSLNDQDGETDLLLRVKTGGERVAILVENKIVAPAQYKQDVRYLSRGERAQEAGRFERFVTAICAPQVYLDGLPNSSLYQHHIAYEKIRDWYGRKDGPRAKWREAILCEAIQQGRRGYTMKVHAGVSAFHTAFWRFLQSSVPNLIMRRPTAKGSGSNWIYLKGIAFPRGVSLIFKSDQSCVDLQFDNMQVGRLQECRRPDWPTGVRVIQRGKSAAISLPAPDCDMTRPFSEQGGQIGTIVSIALSLCDLANSRASITSAGTDKI